MAEIEGSPTGRSTDPRLAQLMANPWYSEMIQQIDQLRLKNQVVKGPYSFSRFQVEQVTPDGRVIFTDCQTNSQEVYNAQTGSQVTNSGTTKIAEQVVVVGSARGTWRVADDNAGVPGAVHACDG